MGVRLTATGPETWAGELGIAEECAVGNGVMIFDTQLFAAGGAGGVVAQKGGGLLLEDRLLGRSQQRLRLHKGQTQLFNLFAGLVEHGDIDHIICLPIVGMGDELKFELHVC